MLLIYVPTTTEGQKTRVDWTTINTDCYFLIMQSPWSEFECIYDS